MGEMRGLNAVFQPILFSIAKKKRKERLRNNLVLTHAIIYNESLLKFFGWSELKKVNELKEPK